MRTLYRDTGPLYYTIEASELEQMSMRAALIDIGIFVIKGVQSNSNHDA